MTFAFNPRILEEEDFCTELGKKVFAYIKKHAEEQDVTELLNEAFTADEVGRITRMKIARMQLTDNGDAVLDESIRNLRTAVSAANEKNNGVTLTGLSALIDRRKQEN